MTDELSIIPEPVHVARRDGIFRLSRETTILVEDDTARLGRYLQELLQPATAFALPVARISEQQPAGRNSISLRLDYDAVDLGEEGYELSVSKDEIVIGARTQAGIMYGIQTLRQLFPVAIERTQPSNETMTWEIPCVAIRDQPRFKWRGLMLDCSRTFWSKDYVKRTIRLMSLYKLNRLHLHLTDDQGWRLEIKQHPELTRIGAVFPQKYNEPAERQGYYSQDDIKALVEYGNLHNVTIIPEIEMPGHSLAALACYPELSCAGGPFEIHPFFKGPTIHPDIFCAGNEKTFQLLEDAYGFS